ncbi:aminotransferase class I/II-fold pyridoxal phosphate-dependent enzyme [Streptomyces alanosinicus]|nr:aminotransferase class I/II-fold pyridoxal phosphate-dependent enzyme [Streptomyces alanosinicus]
MTYTELLARRSQFARSDAIRDILAAGTAPGVLSMAGGLPAPDTFPTAELAGLVARVLAESPAAALQYAPAEGVPAMREALARLASMTGAAATAGQTLVTSGSQQGIDLVAGAILEEGDAVALDDPSYLGAVQSFRRVGARLLPVPSDEDGMDTEVLAARLTAGERRKLGYVVPHFPLRCFALRRPGGAIWPHSPRSSAFWWWRTTRTPIWPSTESAAPRSMCTPTV